MSEHFFIVKYTPENGWEWDTDEEEQRFGARVYLPETNEWVASDSDPVIHERDTYASDALLQGLRLINQVEGEGVRI